MRNFQQIQSQFPFAEVTVSAQTVEDIVATGVSGQKDSSLFELHETDDTREVGGRCVQISGQLGLFGYWRLLPFLAQSFKLIIDWPDYGDCETIYFDRLVRALSKIVDWLIAVQPKQGDQIPQLPSLPDGGQDGVRLFQVVGPIVHRCGVGRERRQARIA